MTLLAQAQHFVRAPEWTWYIVPYFYLAGLAGGCYVIATLLRLLGNHADEPAARLGYYAAFLAFLPCPVLLTLDLTQPLRFWHMLWNTTPGNEGPNFKTGSPMSVGSWALVAFGLFAAVSFLEVLVHDGKLRRPFAVRVVRPLDGAFGRIWNAVGAVLGLFIAGYTGVLLAVSNQPVWSDGWPLGGVFLASSLTGAAALLLLLANSRRDIDAGTTVRLALADRNFALLEIALIAVFVATVALAGTIGKMAGVWLLLWLVVIVGLAAPFAISRLASARRWAPVTASLLALLSVLALRALVIFSAQS